MYAQAANQPHATGKLAGAQDDHNRLWSQNRLYCCGSLTSKTSWTIASQARIIDVGLGSYSAGNYLARWRSKNRRPILGVLDRDGLET